MVAVDHVNYCFLFVVFSSSFFFFFFFFFFGGGGGYSGWLVEWYPEAELMEGCPVRTWKAFKIMGASVAHGYRSSVCGVR